MTFRFRGTGSDRPYFDQGMISEVRAYWEALRREGDLPVRHQIQPRGISGALENSFLIERIGHGIARFRIAGSVFHDLCGMDVRGMPVSCLFVGSSRDTLQSRLEAVFDAPAILSLDLVGPAHFGRAPLAARMVFLPVSGQSGQCDIGLGCIEVQGEPGSQPTRFSIAESRLERLAMPERAHDLSFEPSPPLPRKDAPPRAKQGAPHLRLVYSA